MASSGGGRNGSSGEDQQGIHPRYRRAFGCVTWLYMGMLVFLAVNFFMALPFRFLGGEEVYGYVPPRLAFLGFILILPGMVLAAVLGARTYRSERRIATRVGAGVGALIGWTGFFALTWLAVAFRLDRRDQIFGTVVFPGLGGIPFYAFPVLATFATALTMYALYSRKLDYDRRRRLVLISAALAGLAGLAIVISDFDPVGVAGAGISTISAAIGGYVSGSGYARAGGDARIPPGAAIKPHEPRSRPR